MVYRAQSPKLTAWVQPNLGGSSDDLIIRSFRVRAADSGKRDLRGALRETAARKRSEAIMASLIVITVVLGVAGALVSVFIAVVIAIHRGHRVRSLIWRVQGQPAQNPRLLTGSGRRL